MLCAMLLRSCISIITYVSRKRSNGHASSRQNVDKNSVPFSQPCRYFYLKIIVRNNDDDYILSARTVAVDSDNGCVIARLC